MSDNRLLLIVKAQYGDIFLDTDDPQLLHKLCCEIIEHRIEDGYYEDSDKKTARTVVLSAGRSLITLLERGSPALRFLASRRRNEHEDFEWVYTTDGFREKTKQA